MPWDHVTVFLLRRRQGTPVVGVVVVKIIYMAAVFTAYSVSKSLPAAVFLFALKARWAWSLWAGLVPIK